MKYEEIILERKRDVADGYSLWEPNSKPYAIYFVYSKCGRKCVVKGMSEEVREFCQKNFPEALLRYTFWKDGRSRGGWTFTKPKIYAQEISRILSSDENEKCKKRRGIRVIKYYDNRFEEFYFRRMPKKWIPEFDH
jgi:hypothetical protein